MERRLVASGELLAQHLALPGELAVLEEPTDLAADVLEDERLQNVVVRAAAQRLDAVSTDAYAVISSTSVCGAISRTRPSMARSGR